MQSAARCVAHSGGERDAELGPVRSGARCGTRPGAERGSVWGSVRGSARCGARCGAQLGAGLGAGLCPQNPRPPAGRAAAPPSRAVPGEPVPHRGGTQVTKQCGGSGGRGRGGAGALPGSRRCGGRGIPGPAFVAPRSSGALPPQQRGLELSCCHRGSTPGKERPGSRVGETALRGLSLPEHPGAAPGAGSPGEVQGGGTPSGAVLPR